ncbi:hypothetical protein Golomagni_02929 [Golovinomyces magnicellulatus]|nr:hypothetical protein Golomagni_02929 [Golovinomyces magnicellulatus]
MPAIFPDFTSKDHFPTFIDCPLAEDLSYPNTNSTSLVKYLLGTIQLEATLSTSPTYICKDRNGQQFAVTVRLPPAEIKSDLRGGGFDVTAWKRGWCLAIPNAKRHGVENGKQGYIVAEKENIMVFHSNLERLIKAAETLHKKESLDIENEVCQACGTEEKSLKLRQCRGCEAVWYCQKVRLLSYPCAV